MELSAININVESLNQLSKIELVQIIIAQQKIIDSLQQKIEKLKISQNIDSKNSSLPPSTDLIKKPEKERTDSEEKLSSKRKPGGQPGHAGKTRIGFELLAAALALPHR